MNKKINPMDTCNYVRKIKRKENRPISRFLLPLIFIFISIFGMYTAYQANVHAEHYQGVVQRVQYRINPSYYSNSVSSKRKIPKYEFIANVYIEDIREKVIVNGYSSNQNQIPKKGEQIHVAKAEDDYVWEQAPGFEYIVLGIFFLVGVGVLVKEW